MTPDHSWITSSIDGLLSAAPLLGILFGLILLGLWFVWWFER